MDNILSKRKQNMYLKFWAGIFQVSGKKTKMEIYIHTGLFVYILTTRFGGLLPSSALQKVSDNMIKA